MVTGINSLGTRLNKAMDNLGYPDAVGDIAGAQIDLATFNISGAAQNWKDLFSGQSTQQFLTKPSQALARSRRQCGHTYAQNTARTTMNSALQAMDGEIMNLIRSGGESAGNILKGQIQKQGGDMESLLGPGASFEDMLAAFLFKQMRDSEKDLKSLMQKYESLKKGKKKGGIFGGIKSAFKSLASKAVTLGGGVLGGLVGGPIGSRLGAAFGGGLGSSMFGKKKASGDVDHSRSVINFKIQQAMNKRKEMYDMISNVLKTMHDMSMTSIRNIK